MFSKLLDIFQSKQNQRIIYLIVLILAFSVIFAICVFPVEDADTWMHLKYGEHILETKSLPQYDFFSYTVTGTRDVDHEWLAQVILYLVYKYLGFSGLVLFKTLIILITFGILLKTVNTLWGRSLSALLILVGMGMMGAFRFVERPEIFTFLLLSILIYILFNYQTSKKSWVIFFLPLIFLFWINVHGGFIIGWGLLGLFTITHLVFYLLKARITWLEQFSLTAQKLKLLVLASFLSILICFVNPYGYEMILLPFRGIFGLSNFFAELNEWKSPFDPMHQPREYVTLFLVTAASLVLLFLLIFRKFNPLYFLIFLFFGYSNFKGIRNVVLYALGIYVPFVYAFKEFIASFKTTLFQRRVLYPIIQSGLIIFLFLLFFQFVFKGNSFGLNYHYFDLGAALDNFPETAVEFIDQVKIEGNMMNQYDLGSFLIWRWYPQRKVFLDGRSGLYGEDFFFRYKSFGSNRNELAKATEEYNFNFILVQHSEFLSNNPDWKMVYFDNLFEVYVRNNERNKEIIADYGYDYLNPNQSISEIFDRLSDENSDQFKTEILRNIAQNGKSMTGYIYLSEFYNREGNLEKSLETLLSAQQINPKLPQVYLALGNYYARQNDYGKAIQYYKKVLSLDSSMSEAHYNLGNVYVKTGKYQKAAKKYQTALYFNNQYSLSYLALGIVYSDYLNDPEKATFAFRKYLELEPDSVQKNNIEAKIEELLKQM
ncbi:MAG: hypothetical protein COT24_05440 [Candidatus Kerfeldbacteria bacterium CG08_land_8_20_14_0_20_40_16]|uniref:Uncharacterized protein n=1 Tax=Candidatus Kerfeldbacteria bacterium CG08_land_8_20_14_0_20_40_16 TaxID=2014244 RepID=A0A2H0YUC3_9BACT|nr:MAG: hypothetical protein COT24_05440 [Candidatus Kerfeldbacteria bacterium CG08_land_8_20_14_0_20_40_16]